MPHGRTAGGQGAQNQKTACGRRVLGRTAQANASERKRTEILPDDANRLSRQKAARIRQDAATQANFAGMAHLCNIRLQYNLIHFATPRDFVVR